MLPQLNGMYLSATVGLNRVALLLGLVKPVDDKVSRLVNKQFIDRKVSE